MTTLWAAWRFLNTAIGRTVMFMGVALAVLVGVYNKGRSDANDQAERKILKGNLKAERDREAIENETQDDNHLLDTARRTGLVRKATK